MRPRAQLTSSSEIFFEKILALDNVTRYDLYWQILTFLNRRIVMTLTTRKIIVLGLIGIIFLLANILVVANWINDTGVAEKAGWVRREFLNYTSYCT